MKKTLCCIVCYFFILNLIFTSRTVAQSLSSEEIRSQLVKDWERAKEYTVSYLNTMPDRKYSFKPVDSIRSFAMQMLHLSQGNLFLMSLATGEQAPDWAQADLEHSPTAQSKDSVMYYVTSSYDFCRNAVDKSDVNKWAEIKEIFGYKASRFAFMQKSFEHQTHHRGQTTIYIRLQGIRPPEERLF